jgi:hypothetical protein
MACVYGAESSSIGLEELVASIADMKMIEKLM